MPKALVLSYPAVYVGVRFVPSLMLSLDDPLLPSKFLKHTLAAYAGNISQFDPEYNANKCDLMSPELADQEILAQYPPTLIQAS